jgi:hypothetical protein
MTVILPEGSPAWQQAVSGDFWTVEHLLQKFDPKSYVTFEWSHDCSKPRVDAYGGGAAVITAQEIKTMSTVAWLNQQIA